MSEAHERPKFPTRDSGRLEHDATNSDSLRLDSQGSPLRMRLHKEAKVLHSGFGFGADEMVKISCESERKKIELLNSPKPEPVLSFRNRFQSVPENIFEDPSSEEEEPLTLLPDTNDYSEIFAPLFEDTSHTEFQYDFSKEAQIISGVPAEVEEISVQILSAKIPEQELETRPVLQSAPPKIVSEPPKIQPEVRQRSSNSKVTPGRKVTLAAWGLDTLLSVSFLVIGAGLGKGLLPPSISMPLKSVIAHYVTRHIPDVGMTTGAFIHFAILGVGFQFLIGILAFLFFRTSPGRLVFGIEVQGKNTRKIWNCIQALLAEVLTLGGIFALPFLLMSPRRVPIFFWIKYKFKGQDL
jgi:hypothetical protein